MTPESACWDGEKKSWQLTVGSWQLAVGNRIIGTAIIDPRTANCQLSTANFLLNLPSQHNSHEQQTPAH